MKKKTRLLQNKSIEKDLVLQEDRAFSSLFKRYSISKYELKSSLKIFLMDLENRILDLEAMKSRILTDDEFISNPDFNTRLNEAKKTYQEVFESHLTQTIEEAKDVSSPSAIPSFILSFLDRAVTSVVDAYDVHRDFSDFLNDRENEARLIKIQSLEKQYEKIDGISNTIDSKYLTELASIKNIIHIVGDDREGRNARILLENEMNKVKELIERINRAIKTAIRHIRTVQVDLPTLTRNALPIELMTAFLVHSHKNGARSVWSQTHRNPIALSGMLKRAIFHGLRESSILANYAVDFALQLDIKGLPQLSKYKHYCLSAVLKRFPEKDYDAQSLDYYRLVELLSRAIDLIRLPEEEINGEEKLELVSCLMLCLTDLRALKKLPLREFLPYNQGMKERHTVVRDSFSTYLSRLQDAEEKDDGTKVQEYKLKIHKFIQAIVTFYATELEDRFRNSEFLKSDLEKDGDVMTKRIKEIVIQLINKEISDASPTPYYTSPLCGLSEFIADLHGKGMIVISRSERNQILITYSGEVFDKFGDLNPPEAIRSHQFRQPKTSSYQHAQSSMQLPARRVARVRHQNPPSAEQRKRQEYLPSQQNIGVISQSPVYGAQKTQAVRQHPPQRSGNQFFYNAPVRSTYRHAQDDYTNDGTFHC